MTTASRLRTAAAPAVRFPAGVAVNDDEPRRCAICRTSLEGRRSNAKFCGYVCRNRASYARYRTNPAFMAKRAAQSRAEKARYKARYAAARS